MSKNIDLPVRSRLEGHLELDADQRAVALREIAEICSGLGMIHELVSQGRPVDRDLARNILSLTESRNADLAKVCGIELETAQERESRFAHIRSVNQRMRELEEQLGRGASVEQTTEHIKLMSRTVDAWWRKEGFGHVSKMEFTRNGSAEIEFSCHLFGDFRLTGSSKPVSDKMSKQDWFVSLAKKGFLLANEAGERDPSLIDNDHNRFILKSLFKEALPSARIISTKNHCVRDADWSSMSSFNVFVSDLADLMGLEARLSPGDSSDD
jgi:hypothetical protein